MPSDRDASQRSEREARQSAENDLETPTDIGSIEGVLRRAKTENDGVRLLVRSIAALVREAAPGEGGVEANARAMNDLAGQLEGKARVFAEALTANTDSQQGRGDGEVAGRPFNT